MSARPPFRALGGNDVVKTTDRTKLRLTNDGIIGSRLKARRTELGLSQTALAEAINLSYQQIQKYERGVDRIAASTLLELCAQLGVPITYFFAGIAGCGPHTEGPG